VVERKNRYLLEVARSMMFTTYVPHLFWGWCQASRKRLEFDYLRRERSEREFGRESERRD